MREQDEVEQGMYKKGGEKKVGNETTAEETKATNGNDNDSYSSLAISITLPYSSNSLNTNACMSTVRQCVSAHSLPA